LDTVVFIALINPGMSLVFAAAFLLLWRHQQHHSYIAILGLSFTALAGAFLLQYFTIYDIPTSKLVSNLLFLVSGIGLGIGALSRFERKPPVRVTALLASIGFCAFVWYLYVDPDITMRIYAINFAFGAITLVMSLELVKAHGRKLIDNLLFGLLLFFSASFFIRPVLVIAVEGPYESYENFHQSLYWITLTFSASLFLLLFALSMITAIALDVMDELRRESQTDPLSGLLNRRGFEEGAAQALHTARRRHVPAALVVCDLDHFKTINDTWGHGCGDAVIAAFASCLRGCTGAGHVVGRIGGEEFAVLLHGANASAARLFAEGGGRALGALPIECLPHGSQLSASFGVAEWRDGESVTGLFSRADAALYEAKKAGRDRVRMAAEPVAPRHNRYASAMSDKPQE
jgi:diguanylate cyclase (GGDEF)-like protein